MEYYRNAIDQAKSIISDLTELNNKWEPDGTGSQDNPNQKYIDRHMRIIEELGKNIDEYTEELRR